MPYFRELKDGNGVLVSSMKMLTKADVEYVAEVANLLDPSHLYEASRNFMGYEGFDGTVSRYEKSVFGHKGKYIETISRQELLEICEDRPMVHQSVSHV